MPPLGAQPEPTFEVVSIKPSNPQEPGPRLAVLPGGRFIMTNAPVSAIVLAAYVDRTGLAGVFDISLRFRPPEPLAGADARGLAVPDVNPDLPVIETALQEQLGLKLETIRQPADVLIVDRIERPTMN